MENLQRSNPVTKGEVTKSEMTKDNSFAFPKLLRSIIASTFKAKPFIYNAFLWGSIMIFYGDEYLPFIVVEVTNVARSSDRLICYSINF